MQNVDLTEKSGTLYKKWKIINWKYKIFESIYKNGKN